jgi:hypothetical protein
MKCPYCDKNSIVVESWMLTNAEHYGGSTFNIRCPKCKGMVGVPLYRKVSVGQPWKSDSKEES